MSSSASFRPLRIALLGYRSHPHVGGQGVYLKYLSQALTRLGHEVDVLSGQPYPELPESVNLIKIPSLDLFSSPNHIRALRWSHLRSFSNTFEWWSMATGGFAEPYTFGRRVTRHLKNSGKQYDVIHDNQSLCHGLITLQKLGFPILATVHHPITRDLELALQDASSWGHRLLIKRWHSFLKMQRTVVNKLKHVITVSHSSRKDIANEFGRSITKIDVIHNGIDTQLFSPKPSIKRIPFRLITTSSSDQALKGFAYLLDALADLKTTFPDIHLVVIGKLKHNGKSETRMKALGLEHNITFKNGIDHTGITHEYARASVAVCPSLYEGFGLPAGEALSCGVPLVSTDGGALPEVVGKAGLIVPAGDSLALSTAIAKILKDPALATQLSEQGRAHILERFCWNRVAETLTDYYHKNLVVAENADH